MLADTLTSPPVSILTAGAVAHATMPPASSTLTGQILNYALPIIYALLTHCLINLFKPKNNATQNNQNG